MYFNNKVYMGKNITNNNECYILPKMANRHGLITGASGSGKTVSLKVMAESFSNAGVPVFLVDVKGDIAGTCRIGESNENVDGRVSKLGLEGFNYQAFPVTFFDVFGKSGHPLRTTIEKIGPRLLSRMLGLSDAQEGILAIIFQIAKDEVLKLNDLQDLKDLLKFVGENKDKYINKYGNITTQSIGTIQRNLLELEQEGGACFFGRPELELYDLFQFDYNGHGYINILDAQELFKKPTLYAVFLIWLLNNLYDNMPEVGDLERPKLILCLDEAHLIFSEMNAELTKQIIQIIKLIRSKGIGVYFISQSPSDIPDEILSQLGNKIQHVLRSYTPSDEKAIKAAANAFRPNPSYKTDEEIRNLSTGEALVSFLNENGEPSIVEKVKILPPQSFMGAISEQDRDIVIKQSRLFGKYENLNNEVSASELVEEKTKSINEEKALAEQAKIDEKEKIRKEKEEEKLKLQKEKEAKKEAEKKAKARTKVVKQIGNKVVNKATTKVVNSIWKSLFK